MHCLGIGHTGNHWRGPNQATKHTYNIHNDINIIIQKNVVLLWQNDKHNIAMSSLPPDLAKFAGPCKRNGYCECH